MSENKITVKCCKKRVSFEFLPLEIVVKIFVYLPFKDVKAASQTCKHWREAIKHPRIQDKFHLELSLSKIISYQNMITIFQKSASKYAEIQIDTCYRQLEKTDIYKLIRGTMPNALKCIKYLVIDRTKLTFDSLLLILSQMTALQNLKLIACELIYNETNQASLSCHDTIQNLRVFEIEKTHINNYEGLAVLLSRTTNLVEFSINCTSYGSRGQLLIQSSLLSEIIRRNPLTLKRIHLKSFDFGEPFLRICNLSAGEVPLRLESLTVLLDSKAGSYIDEFEKFLANQTSLEYLDICSFPNFTLQPERLTNLKHLKVFACLDDLRNFDLHVLAKFENLKTLELKGETEMRHQVKAQVNGSLQEINLEMLKVSDTYIENISKAFINLTVLELSSSKVYDSTMQAIIKNLKLLKKLKVDTFKGSDFGVTGIDPNTGNMEGAPISQLQNLEYLKLFYTRALAHETVTKYFKFSNLKIFYLENTKIRWKYKLPLEYILEIVKNCPELEMLRFSYNEEVSLQCIRQLREIFSDQKRLISRDFKNCVKIRNLA